jgi:hypothetical protein
MNYNINMEFRKGDKVICINNYGVEDKINMGGIYTVYYVYNKYATVAIEEVMSMKFKDMRFKVHRASKIEEILKEII